MSKIPKRHLIIVLACMGGISIVTIILVIYYIYKRGGGGPGGTKYSCKKGVCVTNSSGTYKSLDSCKNSCNLVPVLSSWDCDKESGACSELKNGSGTYKSLDSCKNSCNLVPVLSSWDCDKESGACSELENSSGTYKSLDSCHKSCNLVPVLSSWDCDKESGACSELENSSGTYKSLDSCHKSCNLVPVLSSWDCDKESGACSELENSSGTYKSLDSCHKSCPIPGPPKLKINGAWAGTVGCGGTLKNKVINHISLATALPQDYGSTDTAKTTFFSGHIMGSYPVPQPDPKNPIQYLISVGGSVATPDGWTGFVGQLSAEGGVEDFYNACKKRGITGIDWDLEVLPNPPSLNSKIIAINSALKKLDQNFIVQYTILLGSPLTWNSLLSTNNYDYIALMLYNGGMYKATDSGAGCDWDGWAELFLSQGKSGCSSGDQTGPLGEPVSRFIKPISAGGSGATNLSTIDPKKIILGLITDTPGTFADMPILNRAFQLLQQYDGAGMMIWVIPGGWNTSLANNLSRLKTLGYNLDSNCSASNSNKCSKVANPCKNGCTCNATVCGKNNWQVTDQECAPCSSGQTWWPCDQTGFCECN